MSADVIPFPGERPIPREVAEAAKTLAVYFSHQGIDDWQLMGVCSRRYAYRLEGALQLTTQASIDYVLNRPQ